LVPNAASLEPPPLVPGVVEAVVEAAGGAAMEEVMAERAP